MHEFALSLSQVEVNLLIAVAKWLAIVLSQPLVGVHDLETLHVDSYLGGISIILFVF